MEREVNFAKESKLLITDELIDIFGESDLEILNFVGVTNDVEEYELRFTNSTELVNWEVKDYSDGEGEYEQEEEYMYADEEDKELALSQIQATEAEIAADINKYLKALKSIESMEFEQISREEIFERLKCKCFEWNRIKKRETIKDVIKQICKAKTCREAVEGQKKGEKSLVKGKKKKKSFGVCTGLLKKKILLRKKPKKYTKKELEEKALVRSKQSKETIRKGIKKFAELVQSYDSRLKVSSSISDETIVTMQVPKPFLRAKDSVILKKVDDELSLKSTDYSTESASSTISKNMQHLNSLEKIGKRKIYPDMFNTYLNEFNTIKNFAFVFVDNILEEAETKANVAIIDPFELNIKEYICSEFYCGKEDEVKPNVPSLPENTISLYSDVYGYDLTQNEAKTMVRDIIKYWKVRKTWKYCINVLNEQMDSCSNYYKFEVKWSEPTFSYPVPQVTASVFFTIELSKVKPTLFPPKVTFVFEGERYKFTSYDDIAHEKFLDEIIGCKTAFFKSMRY